MMGLKCTFVKMLPNAWKGIKVGGERQTPSILNI